MKTAAASAAIVDAVELPQLLCGVADRLGAVTAMLRRYEWAMDAREEADKRAVAHLADLQNLDLAIQILADLDQMLAVTSRHIDPSARIDAAALLAAVRLESSTQLISGDPPDRGASGSPELFGPETGPAT